MLDTTILGFFITASLVLLVTPGPAVLYIVTQSATRGTRAGVFSAIGLSVGGLMHVMAAVLGVSAVLATSAAAFGAVKLGGAVYLVWLGIREFRGERRGSDAGAEEPMRRVFARGIWVNVLNPKAAVFFLAFLPQFVRPGLGQPTVQLLLLGGIFLGMALTTDVAYAVVAGRARSALAGAGASGRLARYASGTVYIALGIAAALGSADPSPGPAAS